MFEEESGKCYFPQKMEAAVYSKQYLEGRFGADPFIKKGLSWCDE